MPARLINLFTPKLLVCLKEGYDLPRGRGDLIAGLTVAIVALPLAMALGIASGVTPDRGLFTAIVAGFLISFLGGSRFQIGGPTGAFVVVVYNIVQQHGYDGLVLATLMAGVMLLLFGLARFGVVIKYIPYPLVTGFTSGIAVIIFSSQVKDFLGLRMESVPAEFFEKWVAYGEHIGTTHGPTLAVAAGTLAVILVLRRFRPGWPGFLIGVTGASVLVWALGMPVETIGSRFGGIPSTLPSPQFPALSWGKVTALLQPAFTIAFLAGIESLLSAMVADGMTGRRHKSNCELLAQGIANIASVLFGGIPATGAIARTATSIKSGAQTPVAGMLHAVFILLFMLLFAPLASWIPLPSLAAVLMVVAWNMSEAPHFIHLMSAPRSDRAVLLVTFVLTVMVDLTVAIEVGMVLASILFMRRMAEVTEIGTGIHLIDEDAEDGGDDHVGAIPTTPIPDGVEVFQISGPFFFGVATRLSEVFEQTHKPPRVFILRMRLVPVIDASGIQALTEFVRRCRKHGTEVLLSGVQPQPMQVMGRMGLCHEIGEDNFVPNIDAALTTARTLAVHP
ncbi:sulfate permease [Paramagnetospirillum magneticum]|nr:sulfate permease [Paramagnetospirillum magneticum]